MSNYSLRCLTIFEMLLIGTVVAVALYSISFAMSGNNLTILAQQDLETTKYRNMVIDLGDGVKTRAQLTLPAVGNGPFPGVLLIHGSGNTDMNETSAKTFWEISEYLSERGFAVLRYDKRGIGESGTIINTSIWGNMTINDLIEDSKKALNVLMQQPEVDPKRISLVGHSEGTIIAPRVAIDNSTNVKNIVLMGIAAQNALDLEYYQDVLAPVEYAHQVIDENHTGLISVQQIAKDPTLLNSLYKSNPNLLLSYISGKYPTPSETEAISGALAKEFDTNDSISIDEQYKPALTKRYENHTSNMTSLECNQIECARWFQSYANLIPPLSVIGNVSNSTGILLLNGENDSQTPVEQAFLFQQRLTDVKHPDHTLITYPDLGHLFYPSPQMSTSSGPIPQYVLADLYSWLESHSGLSYPYLAPAFSNMTTTTPSGANETGSSNNMTGATFLYIQGAESGSVSEVNATTSTLELNNVTDKTILFSDRPNRIVESIDTADFIGNWSTGANSFAADPPNVALVVDDDVEQRHDLAVIELYNPEYDSEANTLRYDIVSENATSISLPGEFGKSILVIDDDGYGGFGPRTGVD